DLSVRVGVDPSHEAGEYADATVNRLTQRGETIGSARAVRNHRIRGLKRLVVDADDYGTIHILLARRRENHSLCARSKMRGGLLLARKEPRALENHVDLEVLPRQLGRIALRADLDAIAVHDHRFTFPGDRSREFSVRGVVARQLRVGLRIAEVVDRGELKAVLLPA